MRDKEINKLTEYLIGNFQKEITEGTAVDVAIKLLEKYRVLKQDMDEEHFAIYGDEELEVGK